MGDKYKCIGCGMFLPEKDIQYCFGCGVYNDFSPPPEEEEEPLILSSGAPEEEVEQVASGTCTVNWNWNPTVERSIEDLVGAVKHVEDARDQYRAERDTLKDALEEIHTELVTCGSIVLGVKTGLQGFKGTEWFRKIAAKALGK